MGTIRIAVLDCGVIETCGEGLITPLDVQAWADEIRAVRARRGARARLLFDALAVTAWVPGSAIIAVRSARAHAGQTAAAAFVTRVPALAGMGSVLRYLMPAAPRAVFSTRDDALAFLRAFAATERVA